MNELLKDYTLEQEILAAYQKAKAAGDKEGMNKARDAHNEHEAALEEKGKEYCWVYCLFEEMQKRENEYIDLHDAMQDEKVPTYIESLRRHGIKYFTFSSSWSSAVETAWIFTQNGCSLKGLVEINSQYKNFMGDGYEKAHGYLFEIA